MKMLFLSIVLSAILHLPQQVRHTQQQVKKDTVHVVKHRKKTTVVKGRKARMRMQLQQIKAHKKPLREVDSVQKELDKELHRTGKQAPPDSSGN